MIGIATRRTVTGETSGKEGALQYPSLKAGPCAWKFPILHDDSGERPSIIVCEHVFERHSLALRKIYKLFACLTRHASPPLRRVDTQEPDPATVFELKAVTVRYGLHNVSFPVIDGKDDIANDGEDKADGQNGNPRK